MNSEKKMQVSEGLEYKDMKGIVKPELHIDEFVSKMGNDDNIAVISFYVKSSDAATDLVNWFEKGYEFVLDADKSPGQVKPNRFLVFLEIKRRTQLPEQLQELLEDLTTLLEYSVDDWNIVYEGTKVPFNIETIKQLVPLSPHLYRLAKEFDLNVMREAAGLPTVPTYSKDEDILTIQRQARII